METTLTPEIIDALAEPFALADIEVKPGAVREDCTAALALAYADWRVYLERLDAVVGPANWSVEVMPWGDTRLIAKLTICGVTKTATGEGDPADTNCGTIAEAQAKKRACAEFGLGRYLYNLAQVWGKGSGTKKSFRFDDPTNVAYQMYRGARLIDPQTRAASQPSNSQRVPAEPEQRTNGYQQPDPQRLASARQALAEAEQRHTTPAPQTVSAPAAGNGGKLASERQLRAILALIRKAAEADVRPYSVDAIGLEHGVQRLSGVRVANVIASLSVPTASVIISALSALVDGQKAA